MIEDEKTNVSILCVADLWKQECLPRDIGGLRPCQGPQYSTNTPCFKASLPLASQHTHADRYTQLVTQRQTHKQSQSQTVALGEKCACWHECTLSNTHPANGGR